MNRRNNAGDDDAVFAFDVEVTDAPVELRSMAAVFSVGGIHRSVTARLSNERHRQLAPGTYRLGFTVDAPPFTGTISPEIDLAALACTKKPAEARKILVAGTLTHSGGSVRVTGDLDPQYCGFF